MQRAWHMRGGRRAPWMRCVAGAVGTCAAVVTLAPAASWAQTDRDIDQTSVQSPHIALTAGMVVPQGSWAQSYTTFGAVGVLAGLKTAGNHCLYAHAQSLTGARVEIPGLLSDLLTPQGQIIDNEGDVAQISITGRGGMFGLGVGHIFPTMRSNPNSGWMLKLGAGSLHHNVHFDYTENRIGPLEGDRLHGYDRLRWGAFGEVRAGYWFMSNDQRINAYGGVHLGAAQTFAQRAVNFDTLEPNVPQAWDGWWGVDVGWVLHIYRRAAKEFWY